MSIMIHPLHNLTVEWFLMQLAGNFFAASMHTLHHAKVLKGFPHIVMPYFHHHQSCMDAKSEETASKRNDKNTGNLPTIENRLLGLCTVQLSHSKLTLGMVHCIATFVPAVL